MSAKALLSASVSEPPAVYVEDVFSTYLYTGNGSTQTITNGIDLSGEGGLVWLKGRTTATNHFLQDSAAGWNKVRASNLTSADTTATYVDPLSNGFTWYGGNWGDSGIGLASWTFRKAPKFFDVVTFTVTDGTLSNRRISHSLNSIPGFIVIKPVSTTGAWVTYHRSNGRGSFQTLNTTNGQNPLANTWGTSDPTATDFGFNENYLGEVGATYVAYLFAHDAGGFGDAGTDSVVKCGSYTGTGAAGNRIELGWEPQFILYKAASTTGDWGIHDSMRGLGVGTSATSGSGNRLKPNTSDAESGSSNFANIDATGFTITASVSDINGSGQTYIYIAIRRGPMKTPESGTEVFSAIAATASTGTSRTTGFPVDLQIVADRQRAMLGSTGVSDRLRGVSSSTTEFGNPLLTNSTDAELTGVSITRNFGNTGYADSATYNTGPMVWWNFRRAPGFFDVVAYTGTGANRTVSHNLGVAPELIIVKRRNTSGAFWAVQNFANGATKGLYLNGTEAAFTTSSYWNNTSPTASVFTVGTNSEVNGSSNTYITYLFATAPGVSKVGSYTGTGTTLNVDCGFTAGARFVLIKRTDSTGDWYVWDTARGIISGDDPYLLLNSTAAEVTNTDYIDPLSSGFQISSTAPAAINASGGTYIFLAIA
jgi:hypothetical protein